MKNTALAPNDKTVLFYGKITNEKTITTLEIAEMMEVEHKEILRKLEGTTKPDGSVKQVGIIPVLTRGDFPLSDYFIPSTYRDTSGKANKCYNVTKLGCDFLANKFTGEKGILFTAKYVKRFDEMEKGQIPKDLLLKVNKNYKNITVDDVKCYLAVYSQRTKPNTVSNAKRFLGSFFSWAHDEGYIAKNPVKCIKGIKQIDVPNKHLSLEEEVAVRDVTKSKRDEAIIDFLLSTGVRVGEIAAMNRGNVDLMTGAVTFVGEKNDKERTVYLDVRAKKHLIEYLQTRTDNNEALFVTHRMYKNVYGIRECRRMGKTAYENLTKDICRKAGITDKICTVHVFRKTFATRCAENNMPLEIIQELLGHSSAEITSKHYVAKTKKRVRTEFERCMAA